LQEGKAEEQQAVDQNRQRLRGHYGKSLLRRRGELVERSSAHYYETGGMRRKHLRGYQNILKRQLNPRGGFQLEPNRESAVACFVWLRCRKTQESKQGPLAANNARWHSSPSRQIRRNDEMMKAF
jgi:hypothetical protein